MNRIHSTPGAQYRVLRATLLALITCIGFSAPGYAALIEISVEGTWESVGVDATVNPFGLVAGDKFMMHAVYDDTTFFNGDEGVTAVIDPAVNPGTRFEVIVPYFDGGLQQLVFTHADHSDIGFAPVAQIEFDGSDAATDRGVFRNFEIHVEFLLFGADFDLDLFWDGLPISDIVNISHGGDLAATGSGVDHLSVMPTPVPVPAAVWLFASGLGLLGWQARRNVH